MKPNKTKIKKSASSVKQSECMGNSYKSSSSYVRNYAEKVKIK